MSNFVWRWEHSDFADLTNFTRPKFNIKLSIQQKWNITQLVENEKFPSNFMFANSRLELDPNILTRIDKGFIFKVSGSLLETFICNNNLLSFKENMQSA